MQTNRIEVSVRGQRREFSVDFELELPSSGVSVLFGRSGAGKTTLLRCLAGLERLPGHIHVNGRVWQDRRRFVPPEQRAVGYVFQEAALLPHLSVQGNLEYAFARSKQKRVSIADATRWLELTPLLTRSPSQLSGGERQRVAIARALAQSPSLLLMDEPLASLDAAAKHSILSCLTALRNTLEVPIFYVTHATDEVARLADRVVWIAEGRVAGSSSPEQLFSRLELASSLGEEAASMLPARVLAHDTTYHLSELESPWGELFVQRLTAPVGSDLRLSVRAGDVSLALSREHASSILNVFQARVAETQLLSAGEVLVRLECPADRNLALFARVTRKSVEQLGLVPGLLVFARVKGVSVR